MQRFFPSWHAKSKVMRHRFPISVFANQNVALFRTQDGQCFSPDRTSPRPPSLAGRGATLMVVTVVGFSDLDAWATSHSRVLS